MKSTVVSGLVTALFASTTVSALRTKQSGPFALKLVAPDNPALDGQYLYACHAGAAMDGLCLGSREVPTDRSGQFYFNQTSYNDVTYSDTGALVWNLQYRTGNGTNATVSNPMSLQYEPSTNVAVPLFQPGYATFEVGFNDSALYVPSSYDDKHLQEGVFPFQTLNQLQQWYICYAQVGGYYFDSLAWVTAGVPSNPTCQAVTVVQA